MAPSAAPRGIGLGLRHEIADAMFEQGADEIAWVEIHPENYVARGGRFARHLERARSIWPVVPHGLSLGFGSLEPFDRDYLRALRRFLESIGAPWYSDHLCFAGVDGVALHDLLPLPFTRDAVTLVRARIAELEDALGIPVAIENVSYYASLGRPTMDEAQFLGEVLDGSSARLLLDVNNVYVNARNHGFDPYAFVDRLPLDRVVQVHVAGHLERPGSPLIDTHAEPVRDEVYDLLAHTLRATGPTPVLLERDGNFGTFEPLLDEVRRLRAIADEAERARVEGVR